MMFFVSILWISLEVFSSIHGQTCSSNDECQDALGMETGAIPDAHIRASSEWDEHHAAVQGRLYFKSGEVKQGAWSARADDVNPWLQVDLGNQHTQVTGVASQGRNGHTQWVTKYKLQYSHDGVNFYYYKDHGQSGAKEFVGNTDMDTVVYHKLANAVRARYIRFRPTAWHGQKSMRVEVYGCQDSCRQIEFRLDHTFDGKRLTNHVIRSVDVIDADFCEMVCYMEPNCVSLNFKKAASENGKYGCELNNSTFEGQKNKLKTNSDYIYRGAKNACGKKTCKNKATCQTGFTDKGYRCLCTAGFIGQHCEKAVKSCQDYFDAYQEKIRRSGVSHVVTLILDLKPISVLCHMGDFGCGDGGWTPVMKMNGNKNTFHYDSQRWRNKDIFNPEGGKTGFDTKETKLPTYWNTSFSKICLGMKIDEHIKFIVINKEAQSLHSLIADGQYRTTSLGRETWKSLIGSEGSLQPNCNKEGFNAVGIDSAASKARIGILGNNENDCNTCDSRIGFGTGGFHDDNNTCGNECQHNSHKSDKHIKAMGYILVQ